MSKGKWIMVVGCAGVLVLAACWFSTGYTMKKAVRNAADGSSAYAIILGAKVNGTVPSKSLQYRLEAAFDYAEKHPGVILVLSGGQGPDEGVSEGAAMRDYLVTRGLPEERLLVEDQSTSTYENLVNSKRLLPAGQSKVTLITSDYHVARAGILAKRIGLDWDAVPAETPQSVKVKTDIRERLALLKTWVAGK
ncbi:YdcF family protein [Sporosarcina koreensis]|uniref:YdcF family protein n=1 Tax=Sporosarcina koreensis TaxID=334735 RepID=UPI001FD1FD07|nr:YdcF family protein [Sporosarcina koreensis]